MKPQPLHGEYENSHNSDTFAWEILISLSGAVSLSSLIFQESFKEMLEYKIIND